MGTENSIIVHQQCIKNYHVLIAHHSQMKSSHIMVYSYLYWTFKTVYIICIRICRFNAYMSSTK